MLCCAGLLFFNGVLGHLNPTPVVGNCTLYDRGYEWDCYYPSNFRPTLPVNGFSDVIAEYGEPDDVIRDAAGDQFIYNNIEGYSVTYSERPERYIGAIHWEK